MITKFVLNSILHHVGMLWIIFSNEKKEYEMDKSNHPDWLNKGPWFKTYPSVQGCMEDFLEIL